MRVGWPLDLRESGFAAATIMLAATICARGVMEESRPPAEASLRAGQPTPGAPLTISGMTGTRQKQLDAYAQSLRFSTFEATAGRRPTPVVEVVIPVPPAVCSRETLSRYLACGVVSPIETSFASLDWSRVMNLSIRFDHPNSLTVDSVASSVGSLLRTWTIGATAAGARIEVHCLRPAGFQLVLAGKPFKARCAPGGRLLRLAFDSPSSEAPTVFLDGARALALKTTGSRVAASAEAGIVSVGGSPTEVDRRRRIVVRSDSADVALDLGVGPDSSDRHLEVSGPQVASVMVGRQERLPTRFDAVRDLWLAVFGTILGLQLASLGALLAAWPRRTGD